MGAARLGSEILINSTTAGSQTFAGMAELSNGDQVVVWTSESGDLFYRIFNPEFTQSGPETAVGAASGAQTYPKIIPLGDGFVIAWQDDSHLGGDAFFTAIKAQMFDGEGAPTTPEFLVNTAVASSQVVPDLAPAGDGGFVIVWSDNSREGGDTSWSAVKGQRFAADGTKAGGEFLVNTAVADEQQGARVIGVESGGFFVSWNDQSKTAPDTSALAVRGQLFDAGGGRVGGEVLVNTTTESTQDSGFSVALSSGRHVVIWRDTGVETFSGGVRAQVFAADGGRVGGEIAVNTATSGAQDDPSAVATETGFIVVWTDGSRGVGGAPGDTSQSAIKAQIFNDSGTKVGDEILVNTRVEGGQTGASVAAAPGGGFVVAWTDNGGDAAFSNAVKVQRFSATGEKIGLETLVNTATNGNQSDPSVRMIDDDRFVVFWQDSSGIGGDSSGAAVKAQVFTFGPTVIGVAGPPADTYGLQDELQFTVTFDEAVRFEIGNPARPVLKLEVDDQIVEATYVEPPSSGAVTELTFRYTIPADLHDLDGIRILELDANGATILAGSDDDAADLTLANLPDTTGVIVDSLPPDTDPPGVTGVTPPADDTYHWDDDLQFTVNFDEAVIVAGGTPRLELKVGEETVYADYIAGLSTATSLTFRYSVAAGDADANGVEIVGLQTNGATIRDAAGNNADLGLAGGVQAGVLVDGVGPTVAGTTGPDPGPYGPGDELVFTVTLSGLVTLNAAEEPARLEITLDGETRYAVYSGGVGPTSTLTFTYEVEAGDLADDGITAASFVDLDNNVFKDVDGNPAALTGLSFEGLASVTVDAQPPTVESITPDATATNGEAVFTVTFSEDVQGVDVDDFVLTPTGGATGTISGVEAVDDRTFEVTVSDASGAGTLRLDLRGSGTGIEDELGNAIGGGFTAGTAVTVDTLAPEAPTISLDAGSDSGASGDLVTSDATPKIGGMAEPFSTVEVSVGGALQGQTTANAGGSWSFELSAPLGDGARNITALAKDAAGNASLRSLVLPLTVDTAAPTVVVSAGSTSLLAGQSTTVTFTFSEVPVGFIGSDVTVQGGALSNFAATDDPKIYSATFTPTTSDTAGSVSVGGSSFSDTAGNLGAAAASVSLATNVPPPAPDPDPPPPPAPVIDGVPVTTTPGTSPSGTPTQTVTIPVVTSSRPDTVGGNNVADIPIVAGSGTGAPPVLAVQAPAGYGLTASGPSAPQTAGTSLTDLIREIQAHTTAGSADQTTLTGGGGGFLQSLTSSTPLLVQTIVPTGGGASAQPLVINGTAAAAGDPMTALVIDTRGLTSGSTLQLNNVEFAAVIGAVTVTGGAGSQVVYGDGASQNILLGADDDVLHGGGGMDTVASAAGDDRLFGDEGADSVSGGIGDDFVHGNAGTDTVSGGDGNDAAYGGKDDDRISGDAGSDLVWGDLGNDFLHGNAGSDTVDGGLGADSVHGGQGDDYVAGGEGDDVVLGDLGDDFVQGGIGNDRALGGAGNDVVHGGQGDDVIYGEAGDDWLSGDRGNDTLTGGAGADRFHAYAQTGKDVVLDFNAAEGDRVVVDIGDAYTVTQGADGVVIAFSAEHQMLLRGVQLSALAEGWIVGG